MWTESQPLFETLNHRPHEVLMVTGAVLLAPKAAGPPEGSLWSTEPRKRRQWVPQAGRRSPTYWWCRVLAPSSCLAGSWYNGQAARSLWADTPRQVWALRAQPWGGVGNSAGPSSVCGHRAWGWKGLAAEPLTRGPSSCKALNSARAVPLRWTKQLIFF